MIQFKAIVKRDALSSLLGIAMMLGGCPKRQPGPSLVYAPTPRPPATATSAGPSAVLVIEEPAPPEPPEPAVAVPAPGTAVPKPVARPRRRTTTWDASADSSLTPEVEQPAAPMPALEPRESHVQQSELHNKVVQMTAVVQGRITHLEHSRLTASDRKTLGGARIFLSQSERALESGDLQRAFNLVRKASLLVDELEPKP